MTDTKNTIKEVKKTKTPKSAKQEFSLESDVFSQEGKKTGSISLPKDVFGLKWNPDLVHQVVVGMMANKRAGIAHTKDRSEVSGGGKKPWKQKGTGRARHGSTRSPIWVGGGTTFGPRNDKDYSKKINKKTRVKALFTVLSRKYDQGSMLFIDGLTFSEIKTKNAQSLLNNWSKIENFEKINSSKKTGSLMVITEPMDIITKSFANLPGITLIKATELNAHILMNFKHVIMVGPNSLIPVLEAKKK